MPAATADEVLEFWFSDRVSPAWFKQSEEIDAEIRDRFSDTHEAAARGELAVWREIPRPALALTIALDQLPRNLFRGSPRAFETDAKAVAVARHALDQGFDQLVMPRERTFFYLPFMHSEDLSDQERSVELYRALGSETSLDFAIQHHDIIARFGRFPHRNAVLGRPSTDEETEFLTHHSGF